MHETKQRLIDAGWQLMLERGYNALGVQQLLDETGVPKGSFYHHFESKEDFALQVIDAYMASVRQLQAGTLGDPSRPPLARVRAFFEGVRGAYAAEGYFGCLLGALGQELSGASDVFRRKLDGCLGAISSQIASCLDEARSNGELADGTDPAMLADVLVDAWEGAALRSRLARTSKPLDAVLDFCFAAVARR